MTHLPLGAGREFDRIRGILARIGSAAAPSGDDCAIVEWNGGTIALSTDATIEGVHFRAGWLTFEEIGWRATARALSDLAAEGAAPVGVLVALAAPFGATAEEIAEVMAGCAAAAAAAGGRVLGGDLAAAERWHLVVTVVGSAGRPVTRGGAAPGDGLWVTGRFGAARAALDAWASGAVPSAPSRAAFARPLPRIAAGQALAEAGAHAMLDISDGLGSDAAHVAAASKVRMVIDLDRLPVAAAASDAAAAAGLEPALYAAGGGEDYELLAAMPPEFEAAAPAIAARVGLPLTRIGSVEAGEGVSLLLGGRPAVVQGWDHFRTR